MNPVARRVQRTYLTLVLGNTLAGSFIWGINTLFLLDAGLTNLEAFGANAFFTAGMVVFEVPTGVVADTWGRRASYLAGTVTLAASTLLYWWMWRAHAPFWQWALASASIGLGFTFFSGALEAWLVDAMRSAGYEGDLDEVFGRGQMITGVAMLGGSAAGGVLAQVTNLGVPYLVRAAVLVLLFAFAAARMRDLGFVPDPTHPLRALRTLAAASVEHGLKNRPVRWIMLAAPFASGAGIYAFYAAQPYLLELYGQKRSYAIAGLAAGLVAGTQIVGGWAAPRIRRRFAKRTTALLLFGATGAVVLVLLGLGKALWIAIVLIALWGMAFAADMPIRQAYVNDMIPSKQRATILSFASLMESTGGVVFQPALGKVADVYGYAPSFVLSGLLALLSLPFVVLSRRERSPADLRGRAGDRDARA